MLERVATIPQDTIAFYGSVFHDITGHSFVPAEVAARIAATANRPVFAFRDMHIAQGLAGGSVTITSDLGKRAAQIGLDYLAGNLRLVQPISAFEVPNVPLFDWRQLRRWGGDVSTLPAGTIFLNRSPTLWSQHREAVIVALASFTLLSFLVVALLVVSGRQRVAIRDRKRMDEALKQSEDRINRALENIPDVVVIYDKDLKIQYINAATLKITGRPVSDFIGKREEEIWPPGVYQVYVPMIQESFNTGEIRSLDTELTFPNGDIRSLKITCVPLLDKKGAVREVMGITNDFTDRKQTEEFNRKSAERAKMQRNLIAQLTFEDAIVNNGIDDALKILTSKLAAAMQVDRVSVWLLSEDETKLQRLALYDAGTGLQSQIGDLNAADFPSYFEALRKDSQVDADDAQNDPRTKELTDNYFIPLQISSLLDSAIQQDGRLIGVLSAEHRGPVREWHADEKSFLSAITNLVAQLFANTERKQAETKLAESEARYRNILEAAPVGIAIHQQGKIMFVNPEGLQIIGADSSEQIMGKEISFVVHPDNIQESQKRIQRMMNGEQGLYPAEDKYVRLDGEVIDVEVMATLLTYQNQPAVQVIITDITERKRLREELEASYALLQIAEKTARFGGWSVDLRTNTITWSDVVADIHEMPRGYSFDLSEGFQFYAPEWREKIRQVFTNCAQNGIPYHERMEIITRTGKRIWVRTIAEAARDEAGNIIKVQGSFQDITQAKKNYDDLQQANEQLRRNHLSTLSILEDLKAEVQTRKAREAELQKVTMAVEQAGEMVIITDPAGTIQYVNPAFETVSGYTRTEVLGQNPRILQSGEHDGAFYRNMWDRITHGQTWHGRLANKRKDGGKYIEETTISPVLDAAGDIINFVAVKHDITEQLELSAQFEQAQKMESVSRLAGGVAHDYNNMLSVIIGTSQLAMMKMDTSDPRYADFEQIAQAAQRSTEITRKLLGFARKQTISPVVMNLNSAVGGMLKMLQRLLQEDITLSWHPGTGVWQVCIDPSQVDQVLMNLCVNAQDAIDGTGEIIIETDNKVFDSDYCAKHTGFTPGEFVMLAVSDNGCGMDKKHPGSHFRTLFHHQAGGAGHRTGTGHGIRCHETEQRFLQCLQRARPGDDL